MPAAPRRAAARAVAASVAVVAGLLPVALHSNASADVVDPTTTTSDGGLPTTVTITPSTTVTSEAPTTTTTRSSSTTTTTSPLPEGDATNSEGDAPGVDHTIPPWAIPIIRGVKRTKPNDTTALLAALSRLEGFGYSARESAVIGFGRFPVAGVAHFTDDWLTPRFTPTFHLHEGNDIFAAKGTPVLAPYDGALTFLDEPVGGIDEFLTLPDKTYMLLAHLSAHIDVEPGTAVHAGDVIGLVGNTGDAAGGASHLHFEIHPRGGAAINPKPILDRWLVDAIAAVPALVGRLAGSTTPALLATGLTRGTAAGDLFAAPDTASVAELLWSAPISPSGPLAYAEEEAARIADAVDWG